MEDNELFKCFEDFWILTQDFNDFQRNKILKSLPKHKMNSLVKEIKVEKWEDLIYRNKIDNLIDEVKELFNVDLLDKRRKVIKGKSQYISAKCWEYFVQSLFEITDNQKHFKYVLGNINIEIEGDAVLLYLINQREKHGSKE